MIKAKDIRKSLSLAFEINKNNIETKIAITGTNGKTSVAYFLSYLLRISGKSSHYRHFRKLCIKENKYNLLHPNRLILKQLKKIGQKNKIFSCGSIKSWLTSKQILWDNFDVCALTNISMIMIIIKL